MCAHVEIADPGQWETVEAGNGTLLWRTAVGGQRPQGLPAPDRILDWIRAQRGNWAAIYMTDDAAYLMTDQARSFPIHVAMGSPSVVSSSIEALRARVSFVRNDDAAREFLHSGYVLGADTLIEGVTSLPTSTVAVLRGSSMTQHQYVNFYSEHSTDSTSFWAAVKDELRAAYADLIERAGGRQLLIPLSGGIDSRLQLAVLRELKAPNVLTFTYGRKGSAEAGISQRSADVAGFPWVFIEQDGPRVKQAWNDGANVAFLRAAWEGNALPHIQDWYALGRLKEHPDVEGGAIVLPGHTVVGNQHHAHLLDPNSEATKADVARALAENHLALQRRPGSALSTPYTRTKVKAFLDQWWGGGDPQRRADIMHHFNVDNRQAKYISNSVRAYEYFGFDWALPMYERTFHELWLSGPSSIYHPDRAEYRTFTDRWFADVTGETFGYFRMAPAPRISRGRQQLLAIAKAMRVVDTVNFLNSVKTQLHHPMGFEGFAYGLSERALAVRLLRGQTLFGLFAELFLANAWVPGQDVVPPAQGAK
ncbi:MULTISPECIES: hypothetical protein [Trueperella]|uniref:asparagine synthase (glutamine-hydrolyzing) n=1 Tax=Trueperella bernardiae TaxID=59561 RepID=A0AAW6ZIK1_9ACTO|nr:MULTISPECIES: hypothetical protein [Trueperella]MDK8601466.1 hypothetical protein [Trueperella bernardiae]OFS67095.1 hypothetical protein HMPREF3174_04755 [Trueperella sp. HMSC08H06]WIM08259.1 hypothetical protein QPC17_01605 [Trueperella bernardiae]